MYGPSCQSVALSMRFLHCEHVPCSQKFSLNRNFAKYVQCRKKLWSSVCTLDTVEQVPPMQQVAGSLDKKKLPLTAGDYK